MTLPLSITIDLDLEALKDYLAQFKATTQWSSRTWVAGIDGDIKNISSMKALTGVDVMVLYISSSVTAEICSMIAFIADKNNIREAVQPMKMHLEWWCQLEGAKSEQLILHKPS